MISVPSISAATVPAPAPAGVVAAASPAQTGAVTDPQVVEAAKGFEGVFMSMLVNEMFKGTELTQGNSIYSGLMTEKFGDAMAGSGGFGLAAMLTRQLGGEK